MCPLTTEDAPDRPFTRFTAPRGERTLLAVCSDPHLSPTERGTTKVYHRTEERLRTMLADAASVGADAVLCTGDLTRDGEPAEFDLVDDVLGDAELPVFAVPGNHDVPKSFNAHDSPPVSRFAERYTPGKLPYRVRVGDADLLCLDSASHKELLDEHGGRIGDDQLEWLEGALEETDRRGTTPIVVCHHPLAPFELPAFDSREHYRLHGASALADRLAAHDVPLVLSGHVHWPFCWKRKGVRQVVAPATSSYPQAYLLLEITPSGTTIRLRPLADADGLAEAYRYAGESPARGRSIVESTDAGYFEGFPFVDELAEEPRPS